ncbi:MAG TPA: hypothetical protein PKX00_04480 [Opitutaceae bacterium]|nr:hypothetical protein [Opitutaceae bacterium]
MKPTLFSLSLLALSLSSAPYVRADAGAKIHALLNEDKPFTMLSEADFRSLKMTLPDGGRQVTQLALAAPGGAFDPRDVAKLDAKTLGYKADWIVERFTRYNLPWDIGGLRLTSLDANAKNYPWVVILNGGAANIYEFYIDLKNRPGWGQFLAQKLNVLIVSIPGNFKYGGWEKPIATRDPAFLLDRELTSDEVLVYNSVFTFEVIHQGLKQLIMKNTTGDIVIVGHSTGGELPGLAQRDPELKARLKGRYLGWGSGGPVRVKAVISAKRAANPDYKPAPSLTGGGGGEGGSRNWKLAGDFWLNDMARRTPQVYSRVYSRWLNPLYEPGMSVLDIATKWLEVEGRRRANIKQPLQDLEHSDNFGMKGDIEVGIEKALAKTGNPWKINIEDVQKDLHSTSYVPVKGYKTMVWCVGKLDGHWNALYPAEGTDVRIAAEYKLHNPKATIRVIGWDLNVTHYAHVEMPEQLAAAFIQVVDWMVKQDS